MFDVIAYVNQNDLSIINNDDLKRITIINIAFAHIKSDHLYFEANENFKSNIKNLKSQNNNLKIVMSVGGWSSGGFSEIASKENLRLQFANECLKLVTDLELDGIDIDWEYPNFKLAGIKSSPDDINNFTLLLRDIRNEFNKNPNKKLILSIAAGADDYFVKNTKVQEYINYLDYIQLMTYDYRSGFSVVTGHHTNLYTPYSDLQISSADHAVKVFSNNSVPLNKLILGVAFYSREWKNVPCDSAAESYRVYVGTTGNYGPSYDEIIENDLENKYVKIWDDEAKASYLFGDGRFITYDDKDSIREKAEYVKSKSLRGLMFWEYRLGHKNKLTSYIGDLLNNK